MNNVSAVLAETQITKTTSNLVLFVFGSYGELLRSLLLYFRVVKTSVSEIAKDT